jgi:hypothetical protein
MWVYMKGMRGSMRARMTCWLCIRRAKVGYGQVGIPTETVGTRNWWCVGVIALFRPCGKSGWSLGRIILPKNEKDMRGGIMIQCPVTDHPRTHRPKNGKSDSLLKEQALCRKALESETYDSMSDKAWVALCEEVGTKARKPIGEGHAACQA